MGHEYFVSVFGEKPAEELTNIQVILDYKNFLFVHTGLGVRKTVSNNPANARDY
jgi:hypothetical protein